MKKANQAPEFLFLGASDDILISITSYLDIDSLMELSISCWSAYLELQEVISLRCKQECFTTYLYPTIATYRMVAPVPQTWKQMCHSFRSIDTLKWVQCENSGTSSCLRTLKSDNQEYTTDERAEYLYRSGGHYWFSVLQVALDDAILSRVEEEKEDDASNLANSQKESSIFVTSSSFNITMGKWEKLKPTGKGPCPRRHHSMTCLPSTSCKWSLIEQHSNSDASFDLEIPVRRLLFFGGQSEGIPFDAFNDLYLLLIEQPIKRVHGSNVKSRWIKPAVDGIAPLSRSGHVTTLLSPTEVLISGGSNGTNPIQNLDVIILHIEENHSYGNFRWSYPIVGNVPTGRALHGVHRISSNEVLVFGGRQIRQSNGLLDVHRLKISYDPKECTHRCIWSIPTIQGEIPTPRRGHTTNQIGDKLLVFGGQSESTCELHNDLLVLDVPRLRWYKPNIKGQPPCPRRGFKNQFFGTSIAISSGFIKSSSGKVDLQLPESDIHMLSWAA